MDHQIFNTDPNAPMVTEGLIDHLQKLFPLEGFKNVKGVEQLYLYQGAQQVIDHLRSLLPKTE